MPTETLTAGDDEFSGELIVAGPETTTIFALAGNDSIFGTQGDDLIYGGDGNDNISSNFAVLTPSVGGDTVYGGAGDDTITTLGPVTDANGDIVGFTSSSIGDTVYGGEGNDSILGAVDVDDADPQTDPTQDDDILFGGDGDDIIDGNGGEDFLDAGAGNDIIFAGDQISTIIGGDGFDIINFQNLTGPVVLNLGTGFATVAAGTQTITGFESIIGTAFDDTIIAAGDGVENIIEGGGGNDVKIGGSTSDTFMAGAGNDSVTGGEAADGTDVDVYDFSDVATSITVVYTGDEAGTVAGVGTGVDTFAEVERIVFTDGDDAVNAAAATGVTLSTLGGDDFVEASQGADSMDGGAGIDTLSYLQSPTGVTLDLAAGTGAGGNAAGDSFVNFEIFRVTDAADSVAGSAATDTIDAQGGNDVIDGAAGADSILAGIGDDTVRGGADGDSMSGGLGFDTLDYSGSAAPVTVNLATQTATGGDATGDVFIGFEGIIGSDGGDTLTGSALANTIAAGAGDDSVAGGGGNDSIDAGAGGDVVQGGLGNDSMDGGDGFDTLDYTDAVGAVAIDLGAGTATGAAGSDSFVNFEGITGSTQGDTLTGDGADNALDGGAGDDTLDGGAGNDTLSGGTGSDIFGGDAGDDTLFGGDDADTFTVGGGTGADVIDGGAGGTDTDTIFIDRPINGRFEVIYGGGNDESGTIAIVDENGTTVSTITFDEIENVVCFTRGTTIDTPDGPRAIEDLSAGDMVLTRDNGAQPIRWIGNQTVPARGALAPVTIRAGALGNDRDLVVSQLHRMLVTDWRAELMFGEPEVLACAKHLVNGDTIYLSEGGEVDYFHMLLDRHEIVTANGAPSESFHPGEQGMGWMDEAVREEIFTIFPQLRVAIDGFGPSARTSLKGYEARALRR